MGWTGEFDSAKEIRETVIKDWEASGYTILDSASTAWSKFWIALAKDNESFIVLVSIEKREGKFWFKDISEEEHPYTYSCPLDLLKKTKGIDSDDSREWRKNVFQFHANKCEKYELGDEVLVYDKAYIVTGRIKKSYEILSMENGKKYKCGASKMRRKV